MWSLRTARASSQVQVALASVTHAGVLAVPQQRVAANLLPVALGELHHGIGAAEVVDPLFRVDLGPLHVVLGRDRVELGADQLLVGRRVLAVVVDQVALAPRGGADEGAVRACVSQRRLIRPCCRGGEEQRRGAASVRPPSSGPLMVRIWGTLCLDAPCLLVCDRTKRRIGRTRVVLHAFRKCFGIKFPAGFSAYPERVMTLDVLTRRKARAR